MQVDRRLSVGCIWVFWPGSVNLACESHSEPSGEHFRRRQEPALHCAVYRQAIIFLTARGTLSSYRKQELPDGANRMKEKKPLNSASEAAVLK